MNTLSWFLFVVVGLFNSRLMALEPESHFLRLKLNLIALVSEDADLPGYMGANYALEYSYLFSKSTKLWFDYNFEYSNSPLHIRDENEVDADNLQLNSYSLGLGMNYNFWKRSVIRLKLSSGLLALNTTQLGYIGFQVSPILFFSNRHEISLNFEYKYIFTTFEDYSYMPSAGISYGYNF